MNAQIYIRESMISLGDPRLHEQSVEISGRTFVAFNTHKPIPCSQSAHEILDRAGSGLRRQNLSESTETESDSSEDTDDPKESEIDDNNQAEVESKVSEN